MQRRRLLIVTEYFWPDEASTGKLLGDLVSRMGESSDLEITVLTTDRLYRSTESPQHKLSKKETWSSINIIRTASYRSGRARFVKRLLSDVVFSLQCFWYALLWEYDCVFVVTNPPLMPLILSRVAVHRSKPLIYLIHDLYPDLPVALRMWKPRSFMVRWIRRWQRTALNSASKVVVLGRCMRDYLVTHYGNNPDAIKVIPNWFTIAPEVATDSLGDQEFMVLYSGNLGQFQDFDTILGAAELLKQRKSVKFVICGNGYKRGYIEQQVSRLKLTNVILQDFLPEDQFRTLLRRAKLGIVTLEPEMEGLGVPSKSYNLMAMGVPLAVIMGPQAELSRVIAETGCGLRVDHGAVHQLADFIAELEANRLLLADMSQRARSYAHTKADVEKICHEYLDIIRETMGEGKSL